jgi:hypothetical protein
MTRFRLQRLLTCVVTAAAFAGATWAPVHAQALGEVAKKEEARRKTLETTSKPQTAKVYTNNDLRTVAEPSSPAASTSPGQPAAAASDAPAVASPAPPPSGASAPAPAAEPVKNEAYWRDRLSKLRSDLSRDETYVEALQSRVNALSTDFVNRDDPVQRSVIERDRLRAIAELDRLKVQIQSELKAIADLEEEARRASVPPGWLR